jgi:hypothetical protein
LYPGHALKAAEWSERDYSLRRHGSEVRIQAMKRLFASPDSAQLGLFKSRLETAGISCELRNEFSSQMIPGVPFESELWILNDEEYVEASELLAAWRKQ